MFSFCVCPGGQVVAAASEPGRVVTNGMSHYARSGENINGGMLVTDTTDDFGTDPPQTGVAWHRHIEPAAFRLGGGGFLAPCQRVEDFLAHRPSTGPGAVLPSYRPGVTWCDLHDCLPSFLTEGAKTKLAPIVSSARAAKLLCQKWFSEYRYIPDAIVVEGPKAGGHLGYKEEQLADEHFSLEALVPEIVAEVRAFGAEHDCHIPVIAGGGIYTGEDIYRIMQLGADGVQMGTRFVTTDECDADPAFKQSYIEAHEEDIEIIQSPVGMPGRAIRNSFLDRVKEGLKVPKACPFDCIKTCDVTHSPYCIMLALYNAFKGKLRNGYAFCGSNAWRAEKIQSVRELMTSLRTEYDSFAAKCEGFSLREKLFGAK